MKIERDFFLSHTSHQCITLTLFTGLSGMTWAHIHNTWYKVVDSWGWGGGSRIQGRDKYRACLLQLADAADPHSV